jgi:hypothetical protein
MKTKDVVKEQLHCAIGINGVSGRSKVGHLGKSINEDANRRKAIRRRELCDKVNGDRGPRSVGDRQVLK